MYASSCPALNLAISAAFTLPESTTSHLAFPSTTDVSRRRRYPSVNASVSTFADAIPVGNSSGGSSSTTLYEILRVDRAASLMEIKSAYRTLAKIYHPDTVHDDESQSDGRCFIEIHNAYETLSDPTARAVYDLTLNANDAISHYRRRRRRSPEGYSGGYYPTRRWETDQCW